MTEDSRAEKFLELFNKGKEFTEELLRENQRAAMDLPLQSRCDRLVSPQIGVGAGPRTRVGEGHAAGIGG